MLEIATEYNVPIIRLFNVINPSCNDYFIDLSINSDTLWDYVLSILLTSRYNEFYYISDGSDYGEYFKRLFESYSRNRGLIVYTNNITSKSNSDELYYLMEDIKYKLPISGNIIYFCDKCDTIEFYNVIYYYILRFNNIKGYPYCFITNDQIYEYINVLDNEIRESIFFISNIIPNTEDNIKLSKYIKWKNTISGKITPLNHKGIICYTFFSILFNSISDSSSYNFEKWSYYLYDKIYNTGIGEIIIKRSKILYSSFYLLTYEDNKYINLYINPFMNPSAFIKYNYNYLSECDLRKLESYNIGVIFDFSSIDTKKDIIVQMIFYFNRINIMGGLLDKRILLLIYDINENEEYTKNIIKRAINEGCIAIIGGHKSYKIRKIVSDELINTNIYLWNIYQTVDTECYSNVINFQSTYFELLKDTMEYIMVNRFESIIYILNENDEETYKSKMNIFNYIKELYIMNNMHNIRLKENYEIPSILNYITLNTYGNTIILIDISSVFKENLYNKINIKNKNLNYYILDLSIYDEYENYKNIINYSFYLNYHINYDLGYDDGSFNTEIYPVLFDVKNTIYTPILISIPSIIIQICLSTGSITDDIKPYLFENVINTPEGPYEFSDNLYIKKYIRFFKYDNDGKITLDFSTNIISSSFLFSINKNIYNNNIYTNNDYCNFNDNKNYLIKYLIIIFPDSDNDEMIYSYSKGISFAKQESTIINNNIIVPYVININKDTEILELNDIKNNIIGVVGCHEKYCIDIIKPYLNELNENVILLTSLSFYEECNPNIITIGYSFVDTMIHSINYFMSKLINNFILLYDSKNKEKELSYIKEYLSFYKCGCYIKRYNRNDYDIMSFIREIDEVVVLIISDNNEKYTFLYRILDNNHKMVFYNKPLNENINKNIYFMDVLVNDNNEIISVYRNEIMKNVDKDDINKNHILGYISVKVIEYILEEELNGNNVLNDDYTIFDYFHYSYKNHDISIPVSLFQYNNMNNDFELIHKFTNLYVYRNKFPQYIESNLGKYCDYNSPETNYIVNKKVNRIALVYSLTGNEKDSIQVVLTISQSINFIGIYDNEIYIPIIYDSKSNEEDLEKSILEVLDDPNIKIILTKSNGNYLNKLSNIIENKNKNKVILYTGDYSGSVLSPNILYGKLPIAEIGRAHV